MSLNGQFLSLRGVGRYTDELGTDPGVAIYVDGIYTNSPDYLNQPDFFADRIEILRGPQGTLSGRCRHHQFMSNPSAIDVQHCATPRFIPVNHQVTTVTCKVEPRIWTSIADKIPFWTRIADMFSATKFDIQRSLKLARKNFAS